MLTGEFLPSSGDAFVRSGATTMGLEYFSILSQLSLVRQFVGCATTPPLRSGILHLREWFAYKTECMYTVLCPRMYRGMTLTQRAEGGC